MLQIIDLQYFHSINAFKTLIKSKHIVFEQYGRHQKMGFQNRCRIAGANGLLQLTVPLEGGRDQHAVFRDLRICNRERWQRIHWRSIHSAYRRSPWFEFFEDELRILYETKVEYLLDWNLSCFDWVNRALGLNLTYSLSESWQPDPPAGFTDHRNAFRPAGLSTGYPPAPTYPQVFADKHGFIPNLSLPDLVFCTGRKALDYLMA